MQLPVWERLTAARPIQLAIEGTSPLRSLEDLADDPKFTGRLIIGVAIRSCSSGIRLPADRHSLHPQAVPSQRVGHWLSMRLIEPYFASTISISRSEPCYASALAAASRQTLAHAGA